MFHTGSSSWGRHGGQSGAEADRLNRQRFLGWTLLSGYEVSSGWRGAQPGTREADFQGSAPLLSRRVAPSWPVASSTWGSASFILKLFPICPFSDSLFNPNLSGSHWVPPCPPPGMFLHLLPSANTCLEFLSSRVCVYASPISRVFSHLLGLPILQGPVTASLAEKPRVAYGPVPTRRSEFCLSKKPAFGKCSLCARVSETPQFSARTEGCVRLLRSGHPRILFTCVTSFQTIRESVSLEVPSGRKLFPFRAQPLQPPELTVTPKNSKCWRGPYPPLHTDHSSAAA